MFIIIRPLRLAVKALITESTPGQLALGLALGLLVGLVPKGNLTAIVLGTILAMTRANLGVAGAAVLLFSFLSPLLDPLSHSLGSWLLTHPALFEMWTSLYNVPVMPWTDFNNSIVLGSLIIGLACTYPAYRLTKPLFEKYTVRIQKWARRYWLTRLLLGAEWADRFGVPVDA